MFHLFELIIQWLSHSTLPSTSISWWLDVLITLTVIALAVVLSSFVNEHTKKQEKRERAIDELIKTHGSER